MELITILNRCHRFRGFVNQHAHFSADKKSIEVAVRPRRGSAPVCSRCHLPAPGYDQLAERRFEFYGPWIVTGMGTSRPAGSLTVNLSVESGVTRIVLPSISTTRNWRTGAHPWMCARAMLPDT